MKRLLSQSLGILCCSLIGLSVTAGNLPERIDLVQQKPTDPVYQRQLKQQETWKGFVAANKKWNVLFNEETGLPHRAFGPSIPTVGADPVERAKNFVESKLQGYKLNLADFTVLGVKKKYVSSSNADQVNFSQSFKGLPIIGSRLTVKMDKSGGVILFGLDVYKNITISLQPTLTAGKAEEMAKAGLAGVKSSVALEGLQVLPV